MEEKQVDGTTKTYLLHSLLLLLSQHSIRHRFQNTRRRRLQADAFLGLCPSQCHFLVIAKPRSAPAIVTRAIDHLFGIPSPSACDSFSPSRLPRTRIVSPGHRVEYRSP